MRAKSTAANCLFFFLQSWFVMISGKKNIRHAPTETKLLICGVAGYFFVQSPGTGRINKKTVKKA
ncbi:MAG: hypothetical protein B6245_14895 [Desulfobacteraceae bacterium 4572_88]|nr:MAG: hypothetical protein B6245_14895 [Desulfobacteraceae bacterium 4572_88]